MWRSFVGIPLLIFCLMYLTVNTIPLLMIYYTVLPFSAIKYHTISCWIVNRWYLLLNILCPCKINFELDTSGDHFEDSVESALLLVNHRSWMDFLVMIRLAQKKNMLKYCRFIAKDSLSAIPIVGQAFKSAGHIMVSRNWLKDQNTVNESISLYTKNRLPIWIITFPEGTRWTEKKHQSSQLYCQKAQLPVFENCLCPRVKGVCALIGAMRGSSNRHVYVTSIAYLGKSGTLIDAPKFWQIILGLAPKDLNIYVKEKKVSLNQIPEQEEEIHQWLYLNWKTELDDHLTSLQSRKIN